MPIMLSQTYDALVAAGAPDEKARAAAEELADYDNQLRGLRTNLSGLRGDLKIEVARLEGGISDAKNEMTAQAAPIIAVLKLFPGGAVH